MDNTQTEIDKINQAIATQEALHGIVSDEQVATTLALLRQKLAELTAQSAHGDSVGGDKLTVGGIRNAKGVAVGDGAKTVAERGVLVEGDVNGNIITGDQNKVGGIQAKTIIADNVVQGFQQVGGDLSNATDTVVLAEALSNGRITADSIEAKNVIAGFQYIANPADATADELRQEVVALKEQVAEAIAAGDVEESGTIKDVQSALTIAETELEKEEPDGNRVVRKLKEAAELLTTASTMVDAVRETGISLLKFAPVAATLYQISTSLFGD